MKKIAALILAMVLFAFCACAENAYVSAYNAFEKLAFETDNVTMTLNAEFLVDGEVFKIMRSEYRQDGFNSYLDVMLDTPDAYGEVYTGGYTVVGNNDKAFARDTYYGNYFTQISLAPADTALYRSASLNAAGEVIRNVLLLLPENAYLSEDGKTVFSVSDTPVLADSVLTYILSDYIEENYYFAPDVCEVYFNSMDTLIALEYERVTGEKMPETFIDEAYAASYDDEAWQLYESLYTAAADRVTAQAQQYAGGILNVLDNGECVWYASYNDYLTGTKQKFVDYDDYGATYRAYYEKTYGAPYTDDMDMVLAYTENFELWEAHVNSMIAMEAHYQRIADENENCVLVKVLADGTAQVYEKLPEKYEISGETITRRLLKNMYALDVKGAEFAVETDEEGRLTEISGNVKVQFIREDGTGNTVEAEFVFTAGQYGETVVDEFDPVDYNSCMYEEFIQSSALEPDMPADEYSAEEFDAMIRSLPAEIEYAGVVYETRILGGA